MNLVKLFIRYIEYVVVRWQFLVFHELGDPVICICEASSLVECPLSIKDLSPNPSYIVDGPACAQDTVAGLHCSLQTLGDIKYSESDEETVSRGIDERRRLL